MYHHDVLANSGFLEDKQESSMEEPLAGAEQSRRHIASCNFSLLSCIPWLYKGSLYLLVIVLHGPSTDELEWMSWQRP